MSSTPQDHIRPLTPRYQAYLEAKGQKLRRDQESTRSERLLILASAVGLGIAFDYFFNGQRFGISVLFFALLALSLFRLAFKNLSRSFTGSFFLVAALLLSASYGLFNNTSLRFLNGLAIPLALTGYVLAARYDAWQALTLSSIGILFNQLIPQSFGSAPKLLSFAVRELAAKSAEGAPEIRRQILQGLMLAVPLLAVVMILLTSSDAVFSRLITDRFTFLKALEIDQIISHGLITAIMSFYFFGFLWSLKYENTLETEPLMISKNLESISAVTVMGLLCIVYLLFTLVQFTYLYSPSASLPSGLTYADYARRGFFELLAAAFVNITVILAIAAKTKDSSPRLNRSLLNCHTLMTAFTLNLLGSAFYRMHLYESAYGFTELRLFVQFFMAFMAISLGGLLIWIWKRGFPLLKTVLITAITVYTALNYINVDRLIAHNNLERYQLTHEIDPYHLSRLSVDAWPEISAFGMEPSVKNQLSEAFLMRQYPFADEYDRWFEYNWQMSRFLKMEPAEPPVMRERFSD